MHASKTKTLGVVAAVAGLALTSACATMPAADMAAGPTLADREAIEATLYNYARGLDRLDPDLYASAWSEDAVFDLGATAYHGRDEMRGIITGLIETNQARSERGEPEHHTFHMDANPRVEFLSADHAIYYAYFFTYVRVGEGQESTTTMVGVGSTEDELRKIDGEWLIVKRTVMSGP
jgi:3-phenylpropionate/cinnamic acid dioxygenase small subunit